MQCVEHLVRMFPYTLKIYFQDYLKHSHREKALSNKTPALTKKVNINIWVVETSNQLFKRGSYTVTRCPQIE